MLFLHTKNVNRDTNAVAIDQCSEFPRWKSNGKNGVEQTSFFNFFFFFFLEKHYCSRKNKTGFLKGRSTIDHIGENSNKAFVGPQKMCPCHQFGTADCYINSDQ